MLTMRVFSFMLLLLPIALCKSQKDSESVETFDGVYFDRRPVPKRSSASRSSSSSSNNRWPNSDVWTGNQLDSPHARPGPSSSSSSGLTPLAENIKCIDKNGVQSLVATISPPPGFANVPVFEDAVSIHPATSEECSIKVIPGHSITFSMKISNFVKCGVTTQKSNDGKEWLAISIRFPYVGGLRTSDDEHVMIMCRPQERTVTKSHIMDLRSNLSSQQRTIFSSGPHELDTKVSMFTKKTPSSVSFNEELSRNSLIEVGQDLQFRSMVRSGDGWKYAKLKDLTIQKITAENNRRKSSSSQSSSSGSSSISYNKITTHHNTPDSALLVMEDGCRNPVYSAIAPKHPFPDPSNPLVVNFAFKAFMFQDMSDGDTLRITAKIMACQESADCQPGLCLDDEMGGFGRRRRRRRSVPSVVETGNNSTDTSSHRNVHDWTREFELNVVMPGYVKAYASTGDTGADYPEEDMILTTKTSEIKCRQVVFLTAVMSGIFVIVTTIAASVALKSKQKMIDKYYSDMRPSPIPSLPASFSTGNTVVTSRSSSKSSSASA